jgi:DNA modification methylase
MAKIADVQEVSLELLRPYERNAKKHGREQIEKLKNSIIEFGFLTPCLIDSDYNLIAGHGRVMAAKELGITSVPCVFIEGLTEEQRRAYILADNRLGELGEWDMDIVFEELSELNDLGFDVELTGFDMPEELPEVIEDDFDESAVPDEPRTKLGDLYQLGDHRLICGDSTDVNVIERLMGGCRADISFTSPPYNAGDSASLTGNTHMTECKYQSGDDNLSDYDELLVGTTDNMLMFSRWAFINLQMLSNNKQIICEWLNNYRDVLCDIAIWCKTSTAPAMAEKVMNSQFEFIFIFSKENNSRAIGTKIFRGTVSNVYEGSAQRKNEYADVHSATFPIEFVSHFIRNFTNKGDVVLDVFGGTGTTMSACEQLGRRCYMSEIDPVYCDVIIERWENLTGQKAVLING